MWRRRFWFSLNGTTSIPGSGKEATFYSAQLLRTNPPIHAPRWPTPDHITVLCRSRVAAPPCPGCGQLSLRRHSSYPRRLADLPWQGRRGQVEGQVTRLKLVKRQGYGRAKLDLLKARLINAA